MFLFFRQSCDVFFFSHGHTFAINTAAGSSGGNNLKFDINLSTEEELGGFVVVPFVHEEVDEKWVNGVAFTRLASIEEILAAGDSLDSCCQLVDPKTLEFTVPAIDQSIITKMPSWRDVMAANCMQQKTAKLVETLSSFAVNAKTLPAKKVIFNISSNDSDVNMSNKFFTEMKGDSTVEHIKVPFKHKLTVKGKDFESMQCLLIWRICFEGTERPKGLGITNTKKNAIDEICDLMSGL